MTTTPTADVSWSYRETEERKREAAERLAERAELATWEQLDASYDAREAGRFERHLDAMFSGGAR